MIRLEKERKNRKMSLEKVARHTCCTRQAVMAWEKGRAAPTLKRAFILERLFDLPVAYLFQDVDCA